MNIVQWDPELQAERRQGLYTLHRTLLREVFDADGRYLGNPASPDFDPRAKNPSLDPRVAVWHCFPAMSGEAPDIELANGILRNTQFLTDYDFFLSALLQLYSRFRDQLDADIRQQAESCMETAGPAQLAGPGFVGMNDNFPSMEVLCLILLGEFTDRPGLVRNATDKLRELVERLDTYGAIAEFCSPTYTPISLGCMADIVTFSSCAEARNLARRVEQQTWYDLCGRFHPGTSQLGGPCSRSYMAGSCGHMHNARFLFHVVFGPVVQPLSPLRYAFTQDSRLVIHHNDRAFVAANGAVIAAPEYHPPKAAANALVHRRYPFETVGTAGCASVWSPDDRRCTEHGMEPQRFRPFKTYRYAPTLLTTYQTKDYCMGSSSGTPACGLGAQQEGFLLSYRRRKIPPSQTLNIDDVRTVFCRYVYNEKQPCTTHSLLVDEGLKTCVQKGGTSLVLYRPAEVPRDGITSMRTVIVVPVHCNDPDEILIGKDPLKNLEGDAEEARTVFVRDGLAFLAFRPLQLTNYGRKFAVTVRRVERFLTINFYNYQGPPRQLNFPTQAAMFTHNGFLADVATADDGESFAAFQRRMNDTSLHDEVKEGVRVVACRRTGLALRIAYDPTVTDSIPEAWIDGEPRQTPRFACPGIYGHTRRRPITMPSMTSPST